ncbi:MAG: hypothetical protein QJR12_12220 [Mycobacterium sp.]|nr:hypothetical protein [Mycobacterium sp.]MDI3314994.1 hypothetical protein [Mycobacterium sp.]
MASIAMVLTLSQHNPEVAGHHGDRGPVDHQPARNVARTAAWSTSHA